MGSRDYKGLKKLITKVREAKSRSPDTSLNRRSSGGERPISQENQQKIIVPSPSGSNPRSSSHTTPLSTNAQSSKGLLPDTQRIATVSKYGSMDHTPPMEGDHTNTSAPSVLMLPPPMQPAAERESLEMSEGTHSNRSIRFSPTRAYSDDIVRFS